VTRDEQRGWFGDFDPMRDVFNLFDNEHPAWRAFNERAVAAIRERAAPGDILGLTMGLAHKPIADALDLLTVEMGIGYSGVFAPYRVFESYAWMHYLAAREPSDDVRYFDTVIPNAYDADEFPAGTGGGGYHLFMGRFTPRKGIEIAVEATKRLGVKLVIAGPGDDADLSAWLAQNNGHVERVGSVTGPERARLMGEAVALWAPTIYLEPFGSVVTEAMTTGTPAITSDYGAFVETVSQGVSGFRCRTLSEFVTAGQNVASLDRAAIRAYALARYSTAVVGPQYGAYLAKLRTLRGDGWYSMAEPMGVLV
jgi:glycosyltransferase involved in cell wall biosynthesis